MSDDSTFTAFVDHQRVASGSIDLVAQALTAAGCAGGAPSIFDDATGRLVELDLRSGPGPAASEFRRRTAPDPPPPPRGRGRPRLGVVAREVTLLPRHWAWLAAQPGGASAALRRLVEEARRSRTGEDRIRNSREAAYRVMSALGGDLPGFEEASRALFGGDLTQLKARMSGWPPDVRDYVMTLAEPRP